jgi:hypothetical protein
MNSSSLVNLPTELLDEIISHLCLASLFCLATCSQRLFYICRYRILSILKSQCTRLAGTSLICVGDSLAADDYPPGIDWRSKMEELQKMDQRNTAREGGPQHRSASEKPAPKTLYELANSFSILEKLNDFELRMHLSTYQFLRFQQHLSKLPRPNRKDLEFLMNFDHYTFYSTRRDWVLRNLTTKEFIRRSVVGYGSNGPFTAGGVGLGEVLLSRICWSSEPSTSIKNVGIHRGIWAGHKFDITFMDTFEGEVGWKDVSESAYEGIKAIWESKYGERRWEQKWRGRCLRCAKGVCEEHLGRGPCLTRIQIRYDNYGRLIQA